jgi:hypothetical protein
MNTELVHPAQVRVKWQVFLNIHITNIWVNFLTDRATVIYEVTYGTRDVDAVFSCLIRIEV